MTNSTRNGNYNENRHHNNKNPNPRRHRTGSIFAELSRRRKCESFYFFKYFIGRARVAAETAVVPCRNASHTPPARRALTARDVGRRCAEMNYYGR